MLLFLFSLFVFVAAIFICIYCLEVRLVIKDFKYSNEYKYDNNAKIRLGIYILGIRVFYINLIKHRKKETLQKVKNKFIGNIHFSKSEKKNKSNGVIKVILDKMCISRFDCNILIGMLDEIQTALIVGVISAIISILLRKKIKKYDENKYKFQVLPIFNNANENNQLFIINISLNLVLSLKIVHIFNMFKLLNKERIDDNERTSYRRFNANCNGKHKKYDRC